MWFFIETSKNWKIMEGQQMFYLHPAFMFSYSSPGYWIGVPKQNCEKNTRKNTWDVNVHIKRWGGDRDRDMDIYWQGVFMLLDLRTHWRGKLIWQKEDTKEAQIKNIVTFYRVFFLTGPPRKMCLDWPPPQICLDWPPSKFSKCWNHIHFASLLDVFRSLGGPVWNSDDFLKSVTYRPTLGKFRGGGVGGS